MTFTFACVLRSGSVYKPVWVDRLCRQAIQHWALKPSQCLCLTDHRELVAGDTAPLHHPWPGWYAKVELFRPGLFAGPVVYVDLDSLILGPVDWAPVFSRLEQGPQRLALLDDFYRPTLPASGVMAWIPGPETEPIYHEFAARPEVSCRWDRGDGWIIGRHPHVRLNRLLPPGTCQSWKVQQHRREPVTGAVLCFHGQPKNCDFGADHWVTRAWHG